MENASKALLIAGGMLIALLVIGALLLAFNQIGDYEKGKSSMTKSSQVADFNKEFGKYSGDDIKGYDLITLVNKAIDFNSKEGTNKETANSVDYSKKITITLNGMDNFKKNYGVDGDTTLFKLKSYKNQELINVINEFNKIQNNYNLSVKEISSLSANYDSIAFTNDDKKKNPDKKTIKELIGRDLSISEKEVKQYREYSEFKSSAFKNTDIKYDGDQIVELDFEYIK